MSRAYLFLEADRRVYRCQFTKDLTIIGSAPDADIILRDPAVLPRHAQVARAGSSYTLRAVDRSEVRVGHERVDGPHELTNGDRIGIGDSEILFVREALEASTTVQLLVSRPGEPLLGFWTQKSTVTIGRERGDLILDDPLLSRVQCVIENYCEGGQFLLDARSERGTGLNGITIDTRHRLMSGDVVTVGNVKIEVRCGVAQPGSIVPADPKRNASPVQAAAARIDAVRAHAAHGRPTGTAPQPAVPRNPYQRYPSQIVREHRAMDLESGMSTGLVDPRAGRAPQRPEVLPAPQPRGGWNEAGRAPGRGFDDVSTRISHVGNEAGNRSGLWYLPGRSGGPPRPVERPIIRPRGDQVPETPGALEPIAPRGEQRGEPLSQQRGEQRPLIRRPEPAGLRQMQPMQPVHPAQPPIPEPVPVRTAPTQRPELSQPRAGQGQQPAGQGQQRGYEGRDGGAGAPQERWYTPEGGRGDGQQAGRSGDPNFYYLPGSKPPPSTDDPDERLKREFRRPRFGGKTQGFDPTGGRH